MLSDSLTEHQLRHQHQHHFWWKSSMTPIFWLNDSSSCQQFPLSTSRQNSRSQLNPHAPLLLGRELRSVARSWNLRVISRTQQAVKTDNRSSHGLSLSCSAHALAKSIEMQTQRGRSFSKTLLECMQTGENKQADVNIHSASCSVSPS